MALRLLRLFLAFAAFAWGISVVGVFASWPQINDIAQGMGPKRNRMENPFGIIFRPFRYSVGLVSG